jgi:hypothetical protein
MKPKSIISARCWAVSAWLAAASLPGTSLGVPPAGTEQLESAFHSCVGLYEQALPGALMRSIFDGATRDTFSATYSEAVRSMSIEHEHGYSTATAQLKDGVTIAGVPARAIYASTCQLECPLAVFGLEFGPLKPDQEKALQTWAESAPSTRAAAHEDIKVQLNTTSDGQTLLICDISG